ncbi:MAG: GlmU family protein [Flavobacteriia bacterium]|nr:GlmU family protein [Flavobacteriia bacterium]
MNIILHDAGKHLELAPLTLAKPVAELRMGILTIKERWQKILPTAQYFYETEDYLAEKFPNTSKFDLVINASAIIYPDTLKEILLLKEGDVLFSKDNWIAKKGFDITNKVESKNEVLVINHLWDLFSFNHSAVERDFELLTKNRKSSKISESNTIIGNPLHIFLEEGAHVEATIFNTKSGPIYIDKDAEIMEGSMIRGPFTLGRGSCVKMGAKIYGATTIGPYCKVGGEISNSIFQSFSNKGHDGFIGNSVIGEWCNLGADTNSSNLKNNYSKVNIYSYAKKEIIKTDVQFLGLIMGDHSKSGINTMFNTSTVVGFSANIFGGNFPSKHIPSFSWGGADGFVKFDLIKAVEVAKAMMSRRNVQFSELDLKIFEFLYEKYNLE